MVRWSVGMGRWRTTYLPIHTLQTIHNLTSPIHTPFTNPTTYVINPILPATLISYYNIYYPAISYKIPDLEYRSHYKETG